MHPQDYSKRTSYRPPGRVYRRLNWLGVALASIGLVPRGVVDLQVRGRSTGRTRRVPVLLTRVGDHDHVVALAGESQWVRNVRAAGGEVVIRRRRRRRAVLHELPVEDRAPIIAAYLATASDRGGTASSARQAQWYFGLEPEPALEQIDAVAAYYPVFRVDYDAG